MTEWVLYSNLYDPFPLLYGRWLNNSSSGDGPIDPLLCSKRPKWVKYSMVVDNIGLLLYYEQNSGLNIPPKGFPTLYMTWSLIVAII